MGLFGKSKKDGSPKPQKVQPQKAVPSNLQEAQRRTGLPSDQLVTLHKRWLLLDPENTGSVPMERLLQVPELSLCPLFFQVLILVLQEEIKAGLPLQTPAGAASGQVALPPATRNDDGAAASPSSLVPFLVFCEAAAVFVGKEYHKKIEWAFRVYDVDGDGFISDSDLSCALDCFAREWPGQVHQAVAKVSNAASGTGWTQEEFMENVDIEDLQCRMSFVIEDTPAVGPVAQPDTLQPQKGKKKK